MEKPTVTSVTEPWARLRRNKEIINVLQLKVAYHLRASYEKQPKQYIVGDMTPGFGLQHCISRLFYIIMLKTLPEDISENLVSTGGGGAHAT